LAFSKCTESPKLDWLAIGSESKYQEDQNVFTSFNFPNDGEYVGPLYQYIRFSV